jgi:hypothetical protein
MGPKVPRSTVLSADDETLIVAVRGAAPSNIKDLSLSV